MKSIEVCDWTGSADEVSGFIRGSEKVLQDAGCIIEVGFDCLSWIRHPITEKMVIWKGEKPLIEHKLPTRIAHSNKIYGLAAAANDAMASFFERKENE